MRSDYVLDETLTLLFRRLSFSLARKAVTFLDEAIQEEYLCMEWITPERFEHAKKLRLRFQDKPKISFTDLSSMVTMEELGLISILTEDEHFVQVGWAFGRHPNIISSFLWLFTYYRISPHPLLKVSILRAKKLVLRPKIGYFSGFVCAISND